MLLIGLTGGFLTGKSSLAKFLKRKGLKVLDVDRLYDNLLKKSHLKKKLIKIFGENILNKTKISKKGLLKKILINPALLKELERLTHPLIIEEMQNVIKGLKKKAEVLIVEVPLLYEKGLEEFFDKVVVVSSTKRAQFQRAKSLGYSDRETNFFIKNQLPLKIKEKKADWVINNSGSLKDLKERANLLAKEISKVQKLN
ncbi:MAG TPA: dephospho-CoA kinase [Candidatus Omnitrophica bacterium]|nr:MAG: dephospho-CoA kinase [Candidatus Omnitrophota bacterium]RKY35041.1 MAG: dephospho-CoA kinase [Candidatus Omnitrophota bacterium]RKY43624.1 MAG: dephospho-CoA kinase [Candidatus Omnitrophota bacterium]HEC68701.1 dephospho-CoA kinase [Candidatus Omnitrophota bacterium]